MQIRTIVYVQHHYQTDEISLGSHSNAQCSAVFHKAGLCVCFRYHSTLLVVGIYCIVLPQCCLQLQFTYAGKSE